MELECFDVNVNYPGGSLILKVSPCWDVAKVKQEVAGRTRLASQDFKIVFAGQTLGVNETLLDLGLQGYSTLHCIRSAGHVEMVAGIEVVNDKGQRTKQKRVLNDAANALGEMHGCNAPDEHRFYVFCKNPCRRMTPGKLRVRCADCRSSSFELTNGPGGWDDVLLPRRLHGKCNKETCGKSDAEFFFKCSLHRTEDMEDSVALHMVRANTFQVECAVCTTVLPQVVVFACEVGHSMCVQCFIDYCTHQLLNRQFIQDPSGKGYTIQCPAGCQGSEVTEIHHFRLMGKGKEGQDLYAKYQKFATEECILQMGGILCPNRGCGEGLLPEDGGNRIQCPEPSGCGFVFCRDCKRSYHNGPCQHVAPTVSQGQAYPVDPHNLDRARWIEATERFIQNNSNIKPCPRCQVPIEKNGGCMHMVCPRAQCRFEWCWICCIQWDRNCQSSHWFG